MAAFLLLSFLFLIQPAFQISENDRFLIYSEYLKVCIQPLNNRTITLDYCSKTNEWQNFKWVSNDQIMNMAVKLCLTVSSKANKASIALLPCNKTSELQKWDCRNKSLALHGEELFLQAVGGRKSTLILQKLPKNTWTIYGTKDNLCSKGYEALFTIEGNSFGSPCVFPFKYMNKWYSECTREGDEHGRLWCGTTADVDEDSLTGYCPVKDHDAFFWIQNQLTGDFYQINSHSALPWHQARKSCLQQNAELVSITELHEQMYLTGLTSSLESDYWIGLNSLDVDSGWQWMANRPFRYLNWAPGSPSPEPEKICASMQSVTGKWENKKCEEKLGYICIKANSSLDDIPSDGTKPIACPSGWVAYAGHCYQLRRDSRAWKGAQQSCRKEGGDLASIHNIEEFGFVISQLGYRPDDQLWIGLNDQKTQMYFEWSDGTQVRFTKWQRGEPQYIADVQKDCVLMSGENGYWADYFCEVELGYICKKEPLPSASVVPEVADAHCQKGWKRHGFYCYLAGETAVTFSEAKAFCELNKSFLTSVDSRYEQAYLTSLVGFHHEKYFWIGLSVTEQPGTLNWTNGAPVLFTHWNSDMPGQNPGCVAMRTGTAAGLWDVLSCESKANFLCKRWAEDMTTPPAPVTTRAPQCPEEWTPMGDSCIKVFHHEKKYLKTWFEALEFCRTIGGDLVSCHSQEDVNVLRRTNVRTFWIGLNNLDPEKGVSWSDGSPVDFPLGQAWQQSENSCYMFSPWLVNTQCERLSPWVCQIKRGTTLKAPPNDTFDYSYTLVEDNWVLYNSNEYFFGDKTMPMEKARKFCKSHGGDLAVVDDKTEWNFLWRYNFIHGTKQDMYIGVTVGLDKAVHLMNGKPLTFQAWAPNEPNFANDDENCVVMYHHTGLWNDINCGVENSFICKRHNSSVNPTVVPTSPVPYGGCADGWHLYENKCFRIFPEEERKSWNDSRTACQKLGGNLATVPTKAFQAFFTTLLKSVSTDAWIGLNDINWNKRFLWTDGSGVYYTNWATGSPRSNVRHWSREGQDCVVMIKTPLIEAGYWKDEICKLNKSYICQRNSDPALSASESTVPASRYIRYGNSSYSVVSPKMTWEEARKKCRSESADLTNVLDPYDQSFLWLQVLKYKEPVWIGLNSNLTSKTYKWVSNWKLKYANWAAEEPKQQVACVYLDLDGYWKTGSCDVKYFFVCEKYHGGVIPTEPPQAPGRCPDSGRGNQRTWIPFRSHCYSINTARTSWQKALLHCTRLGGSLLSIEDLTEMKFLLEHTELLGEATYWIGLYRTVDGQWKWTDQTAVDYVNWKSGELEDYDDQLQSDVGQVLRGKCFYMDNLKGEWSKDHCEYPTRRFICKTPKIIEESATVSSVHKEPEKVPTPLHGTNVTAAVLVSLILIGAGIAGYVFYRRRRQQSQVIGGFANSTYQDNVIILQNDSESPTGNCDNADGN
ncbi:macrophage mannose receptor 1 [Tiliqua scincoides]|uniref:macrophage mannose receptor 1 n=1 Tax=Tiliqua scincoides TaxID=71010 RepID=UPI003461DACA